jgi:hypothetical protein
VLRKKIPPFRTMSLFPSSKRRSQGQDREMRRTQGSKKRGRRGEAGPQQGGSLTSQRQLDSFLKKKTQKNYRNNQ